MADEQDYQRAIERRRTIRRRHDKPRVHVVTILLALLPSLAAAFGIFLQTRDALAQIEPMKTSIHRLERENWFQDEALRKVDPSYTPQPPP